MSQPLALGIDVGGTSIKCSVIDPSGESREPLRIATPGDDPSGAKTAEAVVGLIDRALGIEESAAEEVVAVGLAVPGIVDEDAGVVVRAVNLGWQDVGFRDLVAGRIRLPVAFGQDVRTGALAEARLGAARGAPVAVFVPIGTGMSIATIVDGRPLVAGGWAGEIGQLPIGLPGDADRPSLESIASASAIAARTGTDSALDAAERVRRGEPLALRVWTEAVGALADALAWTVGVTGAEVIVVGGGLGSAGSLLLEPLEAALAERLGTLRRPILAGSAFGDLSAVVGAGLLAHDLVR
jgi:glucokinase